MTVQSVTSHRLLVANATSNNLPFAWIPEGDIKNTLASCEVRMDRRQLSKNVALLAMTQRG